MSHSKTHLYLKRLLIVFGICLVFVLAFNEATYMLQKDQFDRAPQTIQLVVPAGTAELVAAGQAVPAIPKEMVFMLGDTLQVKNEDVVAHQLGPIWVPPGGTSSLKMEQADKYAYHCSFAATQYLGLDVRQPTTLGVRLTALAFATPTMTALVFLYSLLVFPVEKQIKVTVENNSAG
jgi:hypothetical protein